MLHPAGRGAGTGGAAGTAAGFQYRGPHHHPFRRLEEEPGNRCAHGPGAVRRGQHGGDDPAADGVPPDPADGLCGAGRALRPPPGSGGGSGGSRALSGLSLVRSSLGIVWEPPPRGRILPAARSSRKVQSRRGRRSYRGWGQPGSLATAQNTVGAPAPGANTAGSSEWPEGSIAPGRRSYRGWGQPGGSVITPNIVGAPAPGANTAGSSE